MEIPDFIGGSYKGYSSPVNAQRCVNWFPVLDREGGKPISLQGTPGLKQFIQFGRTDQDLTTYDEVDTNNRYSTTATTLTVSALLRSETACLSDDFTAAFFDTNFSHRFEINISAAEAGAELYPWMLSNRDGEDLYTHNQNNRDYLRCSVWDATATTYKLRLSEKESTGLIHSGSIDCDVGTTYYVDIIRDESVGTYGTLYLNVYTDSDRTVLLGATSVALTEKEDFQYLYAGNSEGTAGLDFEISGTVANVSISSDTTSYAEVRGISAEVNSVVYAAIGSDVVKITTAGAMTDKGNLSTSTGPVYFADNGSKLLLVDGDKGWSIVSDTMAEVTDAQFPADPTSCAYQDGYFMVSVSGTDDWHLSATDDPTSWDNTFASKEGHRDDLSRVMSDSKNVWLFGEESYEVWYNSGDATFPFDRISGTTRKVGLGARGSLAEDEGIFFWFTDNRRVVMTSGYETVVISTPQLEYNFGGYATVSDAVGMARTQEGHTFYTLVFPTQNVTWEYDATTGFWHELESSEDNRWRGNCYTFFNNKHYVGDFELSKIYEVDTDTYTDDGAVLKRIRTASELEAGGREIFFHGLEIIGETGVANASAPGDDPQMTLDWSDNGGRSFNTSVSVDWGTFEDYTARAVFRRLGSSKKRIFRIVLEDQVKAVITGARHIEPPTIGHY